MFTIVKVEEENVLLFESVICSAIGQILCYFVLAQWWNMKILRCSVIGHVAQCRDTGILTVFPGKFEFNISIFPYVYVIF